ncbi:MAG: tRNA (adenosine(37)-N6)-threonylcarbamoyltransferase complex dimerization subunit type 1 TsaB [Spirochaetales bacterium]|nr:tRNA (adenosine(37)-N6)-threonylcarbamoyltransferase complex dimerization subunit type 1 TsaB [Spirochaetales bacterium]
MKNILAVDTASSIMSLCLKKDQAFFELNIDDGLKHSETLMNSIIGLLDTAGLEKKDLDLLVCSEGPGSFTGLRIGMSTVKGLSFGLNIPHTAVITTEYLAYGLDYFDGLVVPVLDARKKRFYCGIYKDGKRIEGPLDLGIEDILKKCSDSPRVLFTGPDCHMIDTGLREGILLDGNSRSGRGRALLETGLKRFESEGELASDSGPLYIRKSEAEIALYGE